MSRTEYQRAWRALHPDTDKAKAKRRKYYIEHRERIISKAKAYYRQRYIPRALLPERERDLMREYERQWREAHREQIRANARRYYNEVIKPKKQKGKAEQ